MTRYKGQEERNLHDYTILDRDLRLGQTEVNIWSSSNVFSALQEVRDEQIRRKNNNPVRLVSALGRLFGYERADFSNFSPYFIVLGYNSQSQDHERWVTPKVDTPLVGERFSSLRLDDRLDLGFDLKGLPLILDKDGKIVYVAPTINIPGLNGNSHKNGVESSKYLKGTQVYTMCRDNGAINRFSDGKLTFSTDQEQIDRIKQRMSLEDVRAITPGMESPHDVFLRLGYSQDAAFLDVA
ncbi:hypothetical protein HYV88_00905 [Candidatus Woesearchaeota archaeon]|nr:hypothetical protein [Candidatus Woesearchaeota archaeon]